MRPFRRPPLALVPLGHQEEVGQQLLPALQLFDDLLPKGPRADAIVRKDQQILGAELPAARYRQSIGKRRASEEGPGPSLTIR